MSLLRYGAVCDLSKASIKYGTPLKAQWLRWASKALDDQPGIGPLAQPLGHCARPNLDHPVANCSLFMLDMVTQLVTLEEKHVYDPCLLVRPCTNNIY